MNSKHGRFVWMILVGIGVFGAGCAAPPEDTLPGSEQPGTTQDGIGDTLTGERVDLRVDPSLRPATVEVDGVFDSDAPRPVGKLQTADGMSSSVVLNELIVSVQSEEELQDILQRCGGVEIERFEPDEFDDPGAPTDVLIAIDPDAIDTADLGATLAAADVGLSGEVRVSSTDLVKTLAAAAKETTEHGTQVDLNWLTTFDGIADWTSVEGPNFELRNAFEWSFVRSGNAQDIGLDAAWQLMDVHGRLNNKVRIMIADGGFMPNEDFPDELSIHEAQWGDTNRMTCSSNPCPYHGTQVAIAAMGRMDNEFAGAGPAAPVAELIAVGVYDDSWKNYCRIRRAVQSERPDIVNMSFSGTVTAFKSAAEARADRHFGAMRNAGALLFAAAGNDGVNVDNESCLGSFCSESGLTLPCESRHVVCVGGMRRDSTVKSNGSNFGTKPGSRSVQIYGPMNTIGMEDPEDRYNANGKWVGGTSFASPFVAGVAALVMAADPTLSTSQVWDILESTAHQGGLGLDSVFLDGSQSRINAYGAVREALGADYEPPAIEIFSPLDGESYSIGTGDDFTPDRFTFKGQALDMHGKALPIAWVSNLDGPLGMDVDIIYRDTLSMGTHTITAQAHDIRGTPVWTTITIHVVNDPPDVTIVAPQAGESFFEGQSVDLVAYSRDPDTYHPLSDQDVHWDVRRVGSTQPVYVGTGHVDAIPPGRLDVGSYVITLTGEDGTSSTQDTVAFQVFGVPPGETVPTAIIDAPEDGLSLASNNGSPREISLVGRGIDAEDGEIPATRMRWTAVSENGTEVLICEGSNFANAGGGGPGDDDDDDEFGFVTPSGVAEVPVLDFDFGILRFCEEATAELGIDPGSVGSTKWTITLEVVDSAGLIGKDKVAVELVFVTE